MRNYAERSRQYEIPRERYLYLCEWCYDASSRRRAELIDTALMLTISDGLQPYLKKYVTDRRMTVQRLMANGLPCSEDYFRIMRKRFYFELDRLLKKGRTKAEKTGYDKQRG